MPKFKVTGGQDGESGVEVAGKRYEPGSTVEMTAKDAGWLVDIGILAQVGGRTVAEPKVEAAKDEDE